MLSWVYSVEDLVILYYFLFDSFLLDSYINQLIVVVLTLSIDVLSHNMHLSCNICMTLL